MPLPTPADQYRKLLAHNVQLKIESFLKTTGPVAPAELAAVVRLDQEYRWRGGTGPRTETYFERFPQLKTDAGAAVELIEAEFHLRRAGGERPTVAAFAERFPEFADRLNDRLPREPRTGTSGAADVYAQTIADRDVARPDKPRPVDPAPSVVIPGYEILGELAHGSMGVIYKAKQSWLNRLVAIKMVRGTDKAESTELIRFLAEAEAIASIKHPHVLNVYEFGEVQGRPYLVMEYVDGGTLAKRLKDRGAFAPADAADLVERLARATHAAHECGIVHRDLKPSNILLQSDERGTVNDELKTNKTTDSTFDDHRLSFLIPKISDFGLAKRGEGYNLTGSRAILGTPSYMAPEQARGETKFVGPSADIYALGAILYECLTGTLPFRNRDLWAMIQSVIHDPPEPPRKRNPKVPHDLNLICLRCLEKEPHKRYATAAALADDLGRFQKGEPVSVRPAGRVQKTLKWVRRHPAAAVLLLTLMVGTPVSAGFAVMSELQAAKTRKALAAKEQLDREKDELMRRFVQYVKKNPKDMELKSDRLAARFFDANPDVHVSDEARTWFRQMIAGATPP